MAARDHLEAAGRLAAKIKKLDEQRDVAAAARNREIIAARDSGATWREIALTTGMTEMGVRKIVQQRTGADHAD